MSLVPLHLRDEETGHHRDPTSEEVEEWRPWFEKKLAALNPQRVVALGREAKGMLSTSNLTHEYLPHPLAVRAYGDSGEVSRKLERIRKTMRDEMHTQLPVKMLKRMDEKQIVTGIVLEPDVEDAHGDIFPADVIEDAAHTFMKNSQLIGVMHTDPAGAQVVESFLAPEELTMGGQVVRKGAWVMSIHVPDTGLWQAIKDGTFTGLSVGAIGKRVPA